MNVFHAHTIDEWRSWLIENSRSATEIWLVIGHKNSDIRSPRYAEAVEQALCFGWIDGLHRKRDAHSSQLRFSPRRTRSNWSALNRERAERMIECGLMTDQGQAAIDAAKARGTWQASSS